MTELRDMECEACRADAPKINGEELSQLLKAIPDWVMVVEDEIMKLRRTFLFADFASAIHFTNQVGLLAEKHGHHPAILTEWGKVTVTWWTHKIKGLHKTDFIMAAKTDHIHD